MGLRTKILTYFEEKNYVYKKAAFAYLYDKKEDLTDVGLSTYQWLLFNVNDKVLTTELMNVDLPFNTLKGIQESKQKSWIIRFIGYVKKTWKNLVS